MSANKNIVPIQTLPLFPVLDKLLIDLLKSLTKEEWNYPTVAKLWTVKDIAAHLLDGNLRNLSASRDNFVQVPDKVIDSYDDLVAHINNLNAVWVRAAKRLSPTVMIDLLEETGKLYTEHLATLDPFEPAIYPVAWAGQTQSPNWFHIAREYTEKFTHQQQIREAVGQQALMVRDLFYPYATMSMYAVPPTLNRIQSTVGMAITVEIEGDCGGSWHFEHLPAGWNFADSNSNKLSNCVKMSPSIAWKLFSKAISPAEIYEEVRFEGDIALCKQVLETVAVMA